MDLNSLTEKAAKALSGQTSFDQKVKFDFGEVGQLMLDGANDTATNDDGEAAATVTVSWDNFLKLVKGELDPTKAYFSEKLKVQGDMSVVMNLMDLVKRFL